ncbi:hypothetical protein [Roseobacter sp. MH60115]|uniref:hypothetical protein n=1 Tax=Roseobacter sp. MH60115 TaxID=2785324 RepID=UPI0018A2930C|nr:hypothetical protein [Roseobacter sp. MH60115]
MTQVDQRAVCTASSCLAVWLGVAAPVAVADEPVRVPEGCAAVATVHKNSCVTTTILQCTDGSWQALSYRRGQLMSTDHYEKGWDFTKWETEGAGAMEFSAVPGTGSAMAVADLAATGSHTASGDFVMNSNIIKDQAYTLSGQTKATGETVTISGEILDIYLAERAFARKGADQVLNFSADIFVSRARDLVVEGDLGRAVNNGTREQFDFTPQAIYGPGEPGFMMTMSEFGCD